MSSYEFNGAEEFEELRKERYETVYGTKRKVIRKMFEQYWKQKLQDDFLAGRIDEHLMDSRLLYAPEYNNMLREVAKKETAKYGKLSPHQVFGLFITLSPAPEPPREMEIIESVNSLFGKNKKGIKKVYWCFEQSGTDEESVGSHPHAHILILRDQDDVSGEPARLTRWIENSNKIVKFRTTSPHYLQIKWVSETKFPEKLAYIQGKKEADKQSALAMDKIWRRELNLQDVYCHPPGL